MLRPKVGTPKDVHEHEPMMTGIGQNSVMFRVERIEHIKAQQTHPVVVDAQTSS
jgi:hypothetical protein